MRRRRRVALGEGLWLTHPTQTRLFQLEDTELPPESWLLRTQTYGPPTELHQLLKSCMDGSLSEAQLYNYVASIKSSTLCMYQNTHLCNKTGELYRLKTGELLTWLISSWPSPRNSFSARNVTRCSLSIVICSGTHSHIISKLSLMHQYCYNRTNPEQILENKQPM